MKKISKIALMLCLGTFTFTSCGDIADEITDIVYGRNFAPVSLVANNIGQVNATLDWTPSDEASSYTIEIFADDSLTFAGTPAQTYTNVSSNEIPFLVEGLVYDTQYSARVMSIDAEDADRNSKWSPVYFKTSAQQIFNVIQTADVLDKSVNLSWPAGETVTDITILDAAGAVVVSRALSADEIAAGKATIDGLTPETAYTAKLYNGTKERGSRAFTTIIDLAGAIIVQPTDDLKALIEGAANGDVFALGAGTYTIGDVASSVNVTKNITIKGIYPTDMPIVNGRFVLTETGAGLSLSQIILDGKNNDSSDQAVVFKTAGNVYETLNMQNCEIMNFAKGFFYLSDAALVNSITINNCLIHDITCDGGDFFDCRSGATKAFTLTNSTVYNSCAARDFIRMDNAADGKGANPAITVDHCTFDAVCNASGKRLLYVRTAGNTIVWTNNLVTNTVGIWSNQSLTDEPDFQNNAYFNIPNLQTTGNFFDTNSPTVLTESPYVVGANGDYRLNGVTISGGYGDPRWAQ